MTSFKTIASWLLVAVVVITTLLLLLPQFIDSDTLKAKLQSVVETQTDGQLNYRQAELSFLPRPSITFHQINLDLPGKAQGTIGSLRVYPELFLLLTGKVQLAKLILESPEISLNLAGDRDGKEDSSSPSTFLTLQNSLIKGLEPLVKHAPDLTLVIHDGTLDLNQGQHALGRCDGLDLSLDLDASGPRSIQATLQSSISELTFHRNGHQASMATLALSGELHAEDQMVSFSLDSLTLAKPALQLKGRLTGNATTPGFEIDLNGAGLDVDEIRKTALTLAGDTSPIKEIFDYLRGGEVPKISFHSQGDTASELGDLKNIVIKGQLLRGAVSISALKLDLTEVNSDVVLADGILEGSAMSARLEGATGKNGNLKASLIMGNDLFHLDLILSADLAHAQTILKRIVETPTFAREIDKITSLKGTGTGKLSLGESLSDIKASIDTSDLNVSAEYQGLPFPIGVTKGTLLFTEDQVTVKSLNGTFGRSTFSALTGNIKWKDAVALDVSSGGFDLVLDELYPWVASFDRVSESLKEIEQITGQLNLAALSFKGDIDAPGSWHFVTTGTVKELALETSRVPTKIHLAQGDFALDTTMLSFQKLKVDGLDADLVLGGVIKGLPKSLDQVELSMDGTLGQSSMANVSDLLEIDRSYTLRTPLTLAGSSLLWQPGTKTSFKGNVSVANGPSLVLDVDDLPERFQAKRLSFKDQYSDASVVFDSTQDELNLSFTGTLDLKTLESLFVDRTFGSGQLNGDFNVKGLLSQKKMPVTSGRLTGKNLVIPISSVDKFAIKEISLVADNAEIKVAATNFSWHDFIWNPFNAVIASEQGRIVLRVTEAKLCGINSFGLLTVADKELLLDFSLEGKGLDVATSYSCLNDGRVKMSGTLDVTGKISSQGQARELIDNLSGPLEMNFTKGTIAQSKLLARTLEVLNVTEIVKGKLPDLASTGFDYSTITLQGNFKGSRFIAEKIYMDGETLDVLGQGELDIKKHTVDVELLAAPFKTVDTVIKYIPGVNYLLAGSLVTIPVNIKGDLSDPKVRVMSVSAVGSGLLKLGERIIKSPIRLIESIDPGVEKSKKPGS